MHKAGDGAAVETDPFLQGFGQIAGQDGDVFLGAEDIGEGEADEFDMVVLDKVQDILPGGVTHSKPPKGWWVGSKRPGTPPPPPGAEENGSPGRHGTGIRERGAYFST